MIERIEQLRTELHLVPFRQQEILTQVDIPEIVAASLNDAFPRVAESSRDCILNRISIKPTINRTFTA
jgi:hypothetical protein